MSRRYSYHFDVDVRVKFKSLASDDMCTASERRSPAGSFFLEFLLLLRLRFKLALTLTLLEFVAPVTN